MDIKRAREVRSLGPYRAVVLGSAVSMARWRRDAMRLLRRRRGILRSERCGCSQVGRWARRRASRTKQERWTKPKRVQQSAAQTGAHEHLVFGGCVSEDAGGFLRMNMAKNTPPEFRDRRDSAAIEAWAKRIADSLQDQPAGEDSG